MQTKQFLLLHIKSIQLANMGRLLSWSSHGKHVSANWDRSCLSTQQDSGHLKVAAQGVLAAPTIVGPVVLNHSFCYHGNHDCLQINQDCALKDHNFKNSYIKKHGYIHMEKTSTGQQLILVENIMKVDNIYFISGDHSLVNVCLAKIMNTDILWYNSYDSTKNNCSQTII